MGKHFSSLPAEEFTASLKVSVFNDSKTILANSSQPFWASVPVYNLTLVLIKCSIILQYLRIFVGQLVRRVCWTLLAIITTYGLFTVFGAIFMCLPVKYFWDKTIEGRCLNAMAFWFSNAAINITSDLAILVTPMPVLKSLHLPKRQKIGLILVFAVGAL